MIFSPYTGLPDRAFWRTGVASQHPFSISDLYHKKFAISPKMKIATAGSCFAQHIGRHLSNAGYSVIDTEPPSPHLTSASAMEYGYGIYSARYGNIYLTAQLLQLFQEAYGQFAPADAIWERDGRYYDAMRPSVEPRGLNSPEEVVAHRAKHLSAVRQMIESMNLFVFTFGLTEGWIHKETGTCYPTAPGTVAGSFDPEKHSFKNYKVHEIRAHFLAVRHLIRAINPRCKFLITVSPVPLTATASGKHVLAASTYSKSVLRAVTGELADRFADVDYFPSFELISGSLSRSMFYSANLRNVEPQGVESVMRVFFSQHPKVAKVKVKVPRTKSANLADEVVCEEALLEAFKA